MDEDGWVDLLDEAMELGRELHAWYERLRYRVVPESIREGLRASASELHWAETQEDEEAMRFACSYCESVLCELVLWLRTGEAA